MIHQWIDTRAELPKINELVFVHSGDNSDSEFPQVGYWDGIAWRKNPSQIFPRICFWMSRDALPKVEPTPGRNVFYKAAKLAWHLEALTRSDLASTPEWFMKSRSQGVAHLRKPLRNSIPGWTEPRAIAELNIWSKEDNPRYPAELDLLVEARNLETGERECFSREEWIHPEKIYLGDIQSRIRELGFRKVCRDV